jgi:hypothetical protein
MTAFGHCASQYAKYWSDGELLAYEGLRQPGRAERLRALQGAAGYFKVARNFHLTFDVRQGLERLAPVLAILEEYRAPRLTLARLASTVAVLRTRLGAAYGGGDRLSASTKFLWLLHREPVVIFDSRARRALRAPAGDYSAYLELWHSGYSENREAIAAACGALSKQSSAAALDGAQDREWFRQRVYDIHLWNVGAP